MSLLQNRLKKAEERAGVHCSDVETYKQAYIRFYRDGYDRSALDALPPYKPPKGDPSYVELAILALSEIDQEDRLKGENQFRESKETV